MLKLFNFMAGKYNRYNFGILCIELHYQNKFIRAWNYLLLASFLLLITRDFLLKKCQNILTANILFDYILYACCYIITCCKHVIARPAYEFNSVYSVVIITAVFTLKM